MGFIIVCAKGHGWKEVYTTEEHAQGIADNLNAQRVESGRKDCGPHAVRPVEKEESEEAA